MGGHSDGRRRFAGFIGLAFGVILLFGAVAMAALRPTDGLAWVDVPQLAPDLGLDAGLRTQPLKAAVVADALRDSALEGSAAESLAVAPVLTVVQPTSSVPAQGLASSPPAARPVVPPTSAPAPIATPTPAATPAPTPAPT
ncbi:MAG TPA: hypothetical protein VIN39_04410, partial [Candidatus Dormibacteraeota bacterium]